MAIKGECGDTEMREGKGDAVTTQFPYGKSTKPKKQKKDY